VEDTDWLGPPIDISDDGVLAIIKVAQIREELGATSMDPATRHLGEAEAIYYIETHESSWAFVSDDQPAADYAENRGLEAALSEEYGACGRPRRPVVRGSNSPGPRPAGTSAVHEEAPGWRVVPWWTRTCDHVLSAPALRSAGTDAAWLRTASWRLYGDPGEFRTASSGIGGEVV
jgi:hypothetical protein